MTLRRYLTRTLFRLAFPTLYCIIAGLVAAQPVGAKVHRVDNTHNADFSSVSDAHTAADGGDTEEEVKPRAGDGTATLDFALVPGDQGVRRLTGAQSGQDNKGKG